ncbi:GntR family transcriptional regulator [Mesorhizobium sp. CAU 1732]|uniref:GntR family transcriptional regulator n=1 Tax=Mesorhizobium sp. CAU 1732 TaxID=3140358 RepID=UPI003260DABB
MAGEEDSRSANVAASQRRHDGVYAQLRDAILTLRLLPGARIAERQLEKMLGSSRTPIREALHRLEADGLVLRGERSHVVAPIDLAELMEVFEYREHIESAIVRLACQRATPSDVERIREIIDVALHDDGHELWFEIGTDFHLELAKLSGNRFLIRAMNDIMTRVARARWMIASMPENRTTAHREHSHILDLILAGRTAEVVEIIVNHTRFVQENLAKAIRETRSRFRAEGLDIIDKN